MSSRASLRRPAGMALLLALAAGCMYASAEDDPAAHRQIPPFEVPAARTGTVYQRFIAFGDWGTGRDDQQRVADAMAARVRAEAKRMPPDSGAPLDFMVTTGDNFYPAGVESAEDPQWRTAFVEVYDAPELRDAPVFPSLGNHDYRGDIGAQVAYSRINPRWRMPGRFYLERRPLGEGHALELFVLDTEPLGWRSGDPGQLVWLEESLAASTATWKVVVGHHPLYSNSGRPDSLTLIRRLEPLFVEYDVDLYVAGHDHTLQLLRPIRGIYHLVSGAGAGPDKAYLVEWNARAFYASTGGGFAYLRASKDELVIEFVRLDGETQYAHTLYKGRSGPF